MTGERKKALWIGGSACLCYGAMYFGKKLLSSMMPQMIESGVLFSEEQLEMMLSVMLMTYGIGQLLNGFIGNRINPIIMLPLGLFLSGAMIFLFPFCRDYLTALILWGMCGFFCSMLNGPVTRLIGDNTEPETGKILLTMTSVATLVGTLFTYLIALITSVAQNALLGFRLTGGVMTLISVCLFAAFLRMRKNGMIRTPVPEFRGGTRSPTRFLWRRLITPMMICFLLISMLDGVIYHAISEWMPTYLSGYLNVDVRIVPVISFALPFVNLIGTFAGVFLLKFFRNDERRICLVGFLVSAAFLLLVYLTGDRLPWLSIVSLFLSSAAAVGINNMVFCVFVLRYSDTGKISGITGILDFACYFAASIASIVFTGLLGSSGWRSILLSWLILTALGIVITFVSLRFGFPGETEKDKEIQ